MVLAAWDLLLVGVNVRYIGRNQSLYENRTLSGVFSRPFNHFVTFLAQFGSFWTNQVTFLTTSLTWGNETSNVWWLVMHMCL